MLLFRSVFIPKTTFSTIKSYYSKKSFFALSSGRGKCGIAVIRVTGPQTQEALKSLTGLTSPPKPRTAVLRSIKHPISNEILDKGLILWFPGPNSFTGEDLVEFHVHGGLAVVNSILDALSILPNLKIAEPGDFTRHAFYNGKLDLTEVEGLSDLLQAETECQRKQAYLQTQGALSRLYKNWRQSLVKCVAHVEAHIDFEETETIDLHILEEIGGEVALVARDIEAHLQDGRRGEILRRGVRTVILGEPNVGKSSLFNYLCKRPAAIVTPIEGTTRDVLEVTLNINGYPLVLADTAGLRDKRDDVIEVEGMRRTRSSYERADLVILVINALEYANFVGVNPEDALSRYVRHYIKSIQIPDLISTKSGIVSFLKPCIVVINKADLVNSLLKREGQVWVSCKTEDGAGHMVDVITSQLKSLCGDPSEEHPSMSQSRHRQHLTYCLESLGSFNREATISGDTVLMAEHLRKGLRHLGSIVGVITTEHILDVVFKDFCIGK